jgi:chromate reductase, NAD(P)H dehydrogenase (quinone)
MKILAFAATTSSQSINKQLVGYATRILEGGPIDDVEIDTLDLRDHEMPIFSVDRQNDGGIPAAAQEFFDRIGASDAVVISFAEHNGFYTAAYKNVFDWASRIDIRVYQDKPAVLFATSPGPRGGANVLDTAVRSGQFFGYDVKASLSIPSFPQSFDTDAGTLTDPVLDEQFRAALATLHDLATVSA